MQPATQKTPRSVFDVERDLTLDGGRRFRIYEVHAQSGNTISDAEDKPALFIFHHGGGFTAQTWTMLIEELKQMQPTRQFGILCYDCRGHGQTEVQNAKDMSLHALSQDLVDIVHAVHGPQPPYELILVGHSLGGAVVVDAASQGKIPSLLGVVVMDVVEGTALEALPAMKSILSRRPTSFTSPQEAVEWALRSNQVKLRTSAEHSIPAQLRLDDQQGRWVWRTDLLQTEPYWQDWFQGLSDKFLRVKGARLLVLAGTDRLDKALTLGQIQGKFQLVILNHVGHALHEDNPKDVAQTLIQFWQRNSVMNLPPALRKKVHRVA